MVFVGAQALQIYTGFAVNDSYANAVSYWMNQLSWSAESTYLEERYRKPILPTMECNPRLSLAESDSAKKIQVYDMIAPTS